MSEMIVVGGRRYRREDAIKLGFVKAQPAGGPTEEEKAEARAAAEAEKAAAEAQEAADKAAAEAQEAADKAAAEEAKKTAAKTAKK